MQRSRSSVPARRTFAVAAAVLIVAIVAAAASSEPGGLAPTPAEVLERINAARAAQRRRPLALDPILSAVAQERASRGVFPRPRPEVDAPRDREAARRGGYEARSFSELLVQASGDADDVLAAGSEFGDFVDEVSSDETRDLGLGISRKETPPLYVFLFARSMADFFEERTAPLADLASIRSEILARVNRERAAAHRPPLRASPLLDEAAERHARDMIARSYYAHESPEGSTVVERSKALGYQARFAGENIARGQYSADEVMTDWMGSPEHRANILAANFTETGSGVAAGRNANGYQVVWVQCFGRPREGISVGIPRR